MLGGRMKRFSMHMHIASYALLLFVSVVVIWFCANSLLMVRSIRFCIDPQLNESVQEVIKERTHDVLFNKWYKPSVLFPLAQEFNYLKNLSMQLHAHNYIRMHAAAYSPLLRFNRDFLLLENDVCVKTDIFNQNYYADIPNVEMPEQFDAHIAPLHLNALKKIPYDLFDQYRIVFYDPTDIELHDSMFDYFLIRADQDSIVQFDRNAIDRIKQDLMNKKLLQSRKKRWIVDIRFKNQIIVNSELIQGGAV